jgi:hypothetical protein
MQGEQISQFPPASLHATSLQGTCDISKCRALYLSTPIRGYYDDAGFGASRQFLWPFANRPDSAVCYKRIMTHGWYTTVLAFANI